MNFPGGPVAMPIDLRYSALLARIKPYQSARRSESAAFLIWYLVNYYRLDELEATDCVCDQSGDKGIDGIYINEGAGTIDVFQSKISQRAAARVGDKQLREFAGTLTQFRSAPALQNLMASAGDAQANALIARLAVVDRLGEYEVRGVFVCNLELDANGAAFLAAHPAIKFAGIAELAESYISDQKDPIQSGVAEFDISGLTVADYVVDAGTSASIVPVLASDLIKLSGIADQSLFSVNVRADLGNTAVNRAIASSIRQHSLHKAFPLFHNGVTVLAKTVRHDEDTLRIEGYYVVNGCQSLNSLYDHRAMISPDLRLLTKFIQVEAGSALAGLITNYSNNQNGVKARDFKSNHPIQTRLQHEFKKHYRGSYALAVKRGEPINGGVTISNEVAGLMMIAFDLGEPWTTHRKYQVFDERYNEVFGRPEVSADKIVMLYEIAAALELGLRQLSNELLGKYVLTKYVMLLAVRKILDLSEAGRAMIARPQDYVRREEERARFRATVDELAAWLVIDLNFETQELPPDFDYRDKLRDKDYVSGLVKTLVVSYSKDLLRKKTASVETLWARS
ncbi:hypothetical protein FHW83_004506 [Duganella sp. SG902]|uniref:AIPR family protein n=1 Tax=Duganella sp. SG902 TaxID=2587016 RepID=UPI00159E9979|nr:AIPR family protein [Duganella sp. SG902]NVM78676.1 hypothetical protein [Duganella sp. SG902]